MSQFLLAGPTVEPLSLNEVKEWLRIETNRDDDILSALIVSARLLVEQTTRRLLASQHWRIVLDAWPVDGVIVLPLAPVLAIDAVRSRNPSGDVSILNSASYWLQPNSDPPTLQILAIPTAPLSVRSGVEIDVTAGYGANAAAVPDPLRHAIRLLVANWYEHRGDAAFGQDGTQCPPAVAAILAPYRRARLK